MARTLKFKDDEKSRERYALLYLAIANSERKNTNADLRVITDLTRELQSVGEEAEKVGRISLYDLKEGFEGEIEATLETAEYKMLNSLIEHTRWSSAMAPQVVELQDWLKEAARDKPKTSESEAPAGTTADE